MLVRQVSVVEKYLVELSFFVYKRCTKEIDIIFHPPNMHLENEEVFSDCIKATISIKNNINFNIKSLNNWKIFKKLRDLRHKLAHGERTICLGDDELDEYNKKFKQALFIEHKITCNKNKKEYTLNTKFELMIEINNLFISFIKEIDREMKKIILL